MPKTNDPEKINELRKAVKYKLIDRGMDGIGNQKKIAKQISTHPSALSMALTGFRNTTASYNILHKIETYLDTI